jgi:hypothetical protein
MVLDNPWLRKDAIQVYVQKNRAFPWIQGGRNKKVGHSTDLKEDLGF